MVKPSKDVKEQKGQKQDDEWHEAGRGEVYRFLKRGDMVTGVYTGGATYTSKFGEGKLYRIKTNDGLKIIFGTVTLNQRMAEVPTGAEVKIVYEGKQKMKNGQVAHQFTVMYKVTPF